MPAEDIIDLSLSTDDEHFKADSTTLVTAVSLRTNNACVSLSENFVDIDAALGEKRKSKPAASEYRETSVAEIDYNYRAASGVSSLPKFKADKPFQPVKDDDPIFWTSSPKPKRSALYRRPHSDQRSWASLSESDEELPNEQWLRTAQQRPIKAQKKSQRTNTLVDDVKKPSKARIVPYSISRGGSRSQSSQDEGAPKAHKGLTARCLKLTEEEKASRAREKEEIRIAAKVRKVKEKEKDKERRRLLKEVQACEKQKEKDRAEANRLKLDKKLSTPEMIVDLPKSIEGSKVDTQTKELLKQLGVEATSYQSPIPNLIKWRRKVESRFNAEKGYREKLPAKEIDPEKHVICLVSANELADIVGSDTDGHKQGLDVHVAQIKSTFDDCILIYMIEGFDVWIRKNRNARNRAYTAAVRGEVGMQGEETSKNRQPAASRQKVQQTSTVDEDMIEDGLLRLQVVHNCLVHHAAAPVETAEWIVHFTEQISQIPYRSVASYDF